METREIAARIEQLEKLERAEKIWEKVNEVLLVIYLIGVIVLALFIGANVLLFVVVFPFIAVYTWPKYERARDKKRNFHKTYRTHGYY
jgi:hypothetical protein